MLNIFWLTFQCKGLVQTSCSTRPSDSTGYWGSTRTFGLTRTSGLTRTLCSTMSSVWLVGDWPKILLLLLHASGNDPLNVESHEFDLLVGYTTLGWTIARIFSDLAFLKLHQKRSFTGKQNSLGEIALHSSWIYLVILTHIDAKISPIAWERLEICHLEIFGSLPFWIFCITRFSILADELFPPKNNYIKIILQFTIYNLQEKLWFTGATKNPILATCKSGPHL